MQFGDLKTGDKIYVLHSNNDLEEEVIDRISSHNGFINMSFRTTNISVKALAHRSIFFDESADVVLFTNKHNLKNGVVEKGN